MNEKILIIDDEKDILTFLDSALTDEGFQVRSALSGAEAIEIFKSDTFDLVITDVRMPGMNGLEVIRQIKQIDEDMEIIILTGHATLENAIQALKENGACDFLKKPLEDIAGFFASVSKALERRRLRKENKELVIELRNAHKNLEQRVEQRTAELTKLNQRLKQEIETRKQAEEKIEKSERELQKYMDHILTLNARVDPDGFVFSSSRNAASIADLEVKDIVGTPFWNCFWFNYDEELQERIKKYVADAARGEIIMAEEKVAVKDGYLNMNFSLNPVFDESDKNVEYLLAEGQDISKRKQAEEALQKAQAELERRVAERTAELSQSNLNLKQEMAERKKMEESLRKSEKKFRDLYEHAPNAYFSVSAADGSIMRANQKASQLLGYDREVLVHMNILELYADTPQGLVKASDLFEHLKEGQDVGTVELQMKHMNDHTIWTRNFVEPIKDQDENLIESRFFVLDISTRKQLESRLVQAQKMESIGTLAGGIAHDFNNILTAIIGYTEIALYDQLPERVPARKSLEQVLKASDRAKNIVKQILTFSRQTEHEIRPLDAGLIIKESLKLLRASLPSTIEVRQNVRSNLGAIMAEPSQIHQVVMNLCTNAFYVMRKTGGLLEVNLTKQDQAPEGLRHITGLLTTGAYLKLIVKDTGPGIDRLVIDKIFDPYFTTKPKGDGTGLGLSVVLGIIENLDGKITVNSEPGKGTTFEVFIPMHNIEVDHEEPDLTPLPMGTERILVVDDEEPIIDLITMTLQSLGYRVTSRTSSIEALEVFKVRQKDFDLVITDHTMPAMTGVELTKEILRRRPDIPIIMCTGFSETITEKSAKAIGIRDFVMKPILRRDMATKIRHVIDAG